MPLRLLAVPAAALLAGVGGGFGLHFALRPAASALPLPELHGQAVWPPHARPAPAFALRDRSGAVVTLGAQRGRTVLLAFLRAGCRRCAQTALGIGRATGLLTVSQRPEVIVVGTGARTSWQLPPGAVTLRGRASALARLRSAYAAHTWGGAVYLIDRRGDERAAYAAPFLPGFVAHDLAVLAEET
ncbi:MAG: hypothetical protein ACXVZ4_00530 [Gaiellaceae bacterium]